MKNVYLGVDLGGTKINIGCADKYGRLLAGYKLNTASSADGIINQIKEYSDRIVSEIRSRGYNLRAVGIGVPGIYMKNGSIALSPNIASLNLNPVKAYFLDNYGVPMSALNDVKCAALGEAWLGKGKNVRDFIYLNIGTGISAGIVIGGKIYEGHNGASGEIAYTLTNPNKKRGFKSGRAPLEEIFSGSGLQAALAKKAEIESGAVLKGLLMGNGHKLDTKLLFEAAKKGEKASRLILDGALKYFYIAVVNLSIILNPEMIVLGGGVSRGYDYFSAGLNRALNEFVPYPPRVELSEFGTDIGLYGAICLARNSVMKKKR